MTIYVDPPVFKWRARNWCHMYTDGPIGELHRFAMRLGLKRSWFQADARLPHYDITAAKRRQAVKLGAQEVDLRFTADRIKQIRSQNGKETSQYQRRASARKG